MKLSPHRSALESPARVALVAALASFVLFVSCSPPIKQPVGAEREYLDAKDLFKKGNLDKALDYTDDLASASPANAYTERARVLRLMIYEAG
jgi:outer membrane protein assembly factor BamD (BamD/ComL family)